MLSTAVGVAALKFVFGSPGLMWLIGPTSRMIGGIFVAEGALVGS